MCDNLHMLDTIFCFKFWVCIFLKLTVLELYTTLESPVPKVAHMWIPLAAACLSTFLLSGQGSIFCTRALCENVKLLGFFTIIVVCYSYLYKIRLVPYKHE